MWEKEAQELFHQLKDNDNPKNKINDIKIDLFTVNNACPITTDPGPIICFIMGWFFVISIVVISILAFPIILVQRTIDAIKWLKEFLIFCIEDTIESITVILEGIIDFLQNQWSPGILIYVTILWILSFFIG